MKNPEGQTQMSSLDASLHQHCEVGNSKLYSKPRLRLYGSIAAVTGSNKTASLCDSKTHTFNGAMTNGTGCVNP